MLNLDDYYSGGYFLLRANNPGWPQLKIDLLPEKFVSLSRCFCPRLEVYWGWTPGDREAALRFGIPQDRLDEFIHWCKYEYQSDLDVVSMFYSIGTARRFIRRFLPDTTDLYLIGAGLHHELEALTWREPAEGRLEGVEKRIEQHLPLEPGGDGLGFEVVSYSYHNFAHSWLCSGLDRDMFDLYGIRPNRYGLIDTYAQARKVHDWIAEDDRQGRRAEPEPYDAWLLVSYPLHTGS